MIKVAFLGIPISGGNYTHFKYLQKGLKNFHIDLVAVGKVQKITLYESNFIHLGKDINRENEHHLASLLHEFLEKGGYTILIPMNSPIAVSLIPFLSKTISVINIVNQDTPRVYQYITSHLDYVSKIVCISKRQVNELQSKLNPKTFNNKVKLIPHGTHLDVNNCQNQSNEFTIGYIGRLHDGHKNILIIPKVLKLLDHDFKFEIIGDGIDRIRLIETLEKYNIKYIYHGEVENIKISEYLSQWDVFLFPSISEGFGITLIEAMSMGVVPIANRINGITDYIITNQKDGFVITNNNINDYVEFLTMLNVNRNLLNKMKIEAKATVKERFDLEVVIEQYKTLFQEVFENPKLKCPKNFSEWKPYREYKPSLWIRLLNLLNK